MKTDHFEIDTWLPASPAEIFEAWLSSEGHSAMSGGGATCDAHVGGTFTAWDGYISGMNQELVPPTRIVQEWRTVEFPEQAPHSLVEIDLTPEGGGTRLKMRHSHIPEGQGLSYRQGWVDHYFVPMERYFGARRPR